MVRGPFMMWLLLLPPPGITRRVGAFSLCVFLLLYLKSVRVVPHGTKGTGPMVRHETSVFEIPKTGTTQLLFLLVLYVFIALSFTYTARRYRTSPGAPDLLVGVGLTPRSTWKWNVSGACSLYWRFLSAGAAA